MKFLEISLGKGNQFWKYLLVIFLSFVVGTQMIGIIPLVVVALIKMVQNEVPLEQFVSAISSMDFQAIGIPSNLGLFLILLVFAAGLFALIGLVWLFHEKRTWQETVNGTKSVRWNRVWMGVMVWGGLLFAYHAADYILNSSNFVFQFHLASFIPLLFISLLFIPLQTSYEEILFRGYFAQGLAALTKSRWVAFLIPSFLFGLMHIANPEIKEFGFWIMMPQYIIIGLVWGLVSILDDGIELALGAHAVNNVFLSLFATHSASALQTNAVFEVVEINPVRELVVLVLLSGIFVAFFYRKYHWNFGIMNKKVKIQEEVE